MRKKWNTRFPFRLKFQLLSVYANDVEKIVAFDPEDAKRAWEESIGGEWDESYEPYKYRLKASELITIYSEPDDFDEFKRHRPIFSKFAVNETGFCVVSAPAWLWVLWNGRGFLCSTEY